MSRPDAVIIGAGHNGLVAANYLADAGLSVRVLERRDLIGGATVTEELIPGYHVSSCSYVSGFLHPRILAEMGLGDFGLRFYQTDASTSNLWRDGQHLFTYNDVSATLRELERVKRGESERFMNFGLQLQRLARITDQWLLTTDPPSMAEVVETFEKEGERGLYEDFFTLSMQSLVDKYFTADIVKGLVAFTGTVSVWGGPRTPGWAYVYAHHATGEHDGHMGQFAFPRGGMGAIAGALARRAQAKGVEISTETAVARILSRDGRVTGVVTADGEEISCDVVLSNADPRTTYLKLVDSAALPPELVTSLEEYDVRGAMSRVFLAVDRLPQFTSGSVGEGPEHRGLTMLGADVDAFVRAGEAQEQGRIADDFPIEFVIQSVHDDSVAPRGRHIITTGVQQTPFTLAESTWDEQRHLFQDKVISVLETYAPGIRDTITAAVTLTPQDYEREYGLAGGNIYHGAMKAGQLFADRPVAGAGGYRSPLRGLYLCGSGTHPGGAVTGTPGRNGATAVLEDRFGAAAARRGGAARTPLVERVMRNRTVRSVATVAARQRFLSRLVERLTARR
ncbi:phytoene desaturase family protein [Lentzea sp. NPDC059081]|uniref:phytoene desaturase family protein n=1 Tax=Lentzea sp. NPDC059081 TaxID=3346719 RepID=UPI0036776E16